MDRSLDARRRPRRHHHLKGEEDRHLHRTRHREHREFHRYYASSTSPSPPANPDATAAETQSCPASKPKVTIQKEDDGSNKALMLFSSNKQQQLICTRPQANPGRGDGGPNGDDSEPEEYVVYLDDWGHAQTLGPQPSQHGVNSYHNRRDGRNAMDENHFITRYRAEDECNGGSKSASQRGKPHHHHHHHTYLPESEDYHHCSYRSWNDKADEGPAQREPRHTRVLYQRERDRSHERDNYRTGYAQSAARTKKHEAKKLLLAAATLAAGLILSGD
jgi:hypothetical protein